MAGSNIRCGGSRDSRCDAEVPALAATCPARTWKPMWNPPGTTPHDTRIMIVDSAGALETRESILSEPALQTNTDRAVGLECSVGVMAYNEEANIAQALESILGQDLTAGRIAEAIVVASGCEDRTAEIVAEIAAHD